MRYKIKDIAPEGLVVAQALAPALLADALEDSGADLERSVGAVHLELHRSADEVYVNGRVSATIGMSCGSCLAPTRVEVEQPVKMVFVREGEERDTDDDALDDEDLGTHDGEYVDLAPMVREQLILSVPIAPRCSATCKGLCPTCGHNLNESDCGHEREVRFTPLSAELEKLKQKQKS